MGFLKVAAAGLVIFLGMLAVFWELIQVFVRIVEMIGG